MSINIVFMGTPDFAVPCLDSLIKSKYNISAVFSQPDKPSGRGHKLKLTPVKELALEHSIPVYQPNSLKDPQALELLKALNPDLIIVVAYGKLLPEAILSLPRLGCVNVHASLLPKLRGAGPIQWSIINGDSNTGITTMYMGKGIDTGDMILQRETPIDINETSGELFERLSLMGAEVLLDTIPLLVDQTAPRTPQNHDVATHAPMITKEQGNIDFNKSATELHNLVRGVNPWPKAHIALRDSKLAVLQTNIIKNQSGRVGEVLSINPLIIACSKDSLELVTIQPPSKKPMSGSSFANGHRISVGEIFTGM